MLASCLSVDGRGEYPSTSSGCSPFPPFHTHTSNCSPAVFFLSLLVFWQMRRDTTFKAQSHMSQQVMQAGETHRTSLVKRGLTLEHFTIAYNSLEGLIAIAAGLLAGSIALVGCGFASVIEVTSGAALLWRLHTDVDEEWRERAEAFTLRIVGVCFLVLALYVGYEAVSSLAYHELPERSVPGILLAVAF